MTAPDITRNSVFLRLSFGVYGPSLNLDEERAIEDFDREARRWVDTLAFPCSLKGFRVVPIAFVRRIWEQLEEYKSKRGFLVEVLCSGRKNGDEIREQYTMEWDILGLVAPIALRQWDMEDLFIQSARQIESRHTEASVIARDTLRSQFTDLVNHLAERLNPGGKKKRFRGEGLGNFREFLATFNDRDITGDAELAALVREAGLLLHDVTPAALKQSKLLRAAVAAGIENIKRRLGGLK